MNEQRSPAEAEPSEATADDVEPEAAEQPEPERSALTGVELRRTVEALLFVADKPLSYKKLRTVLGGVRTADIEQAVGDIRRELAERNAPIELREIGGGLKFCTQRAFAPYIKQLYGVRSTAGKLSPAALETLAVVAYKQPIIRAEIEAIRGVAVDSAVHTLLDRKLIEVQGYKDVPGRPALYGTTQEFLMYFGLNDISDLPTLEELRASQGDGEA